MILSYKMGSWRINYPTKWGIMIPVLKEGQNPTDWGFFEDKALA